MKITHENVYFAASFNFHTSDGECQYGYCEQMLQFVFGYLHFSLPASMKSLKKE